MRRSIRALSVIGAAGASVVLFAGAAHAAETGSTEPAVAPAVAPISAPVAVAAPAVTTGLPTLLGLPALPGLPGGLHIDPVIVTPC